MDNARLKNTRAPIRKCKNKLKSFIWTKDTRRIITKLSRISIYIANEICCQCMYQIVSCLKIGQMYVVPKTQAQLNKNWRQSKLTCRKLSGVICLTISKTMALLQLTSDAKSFKYKSKAVFWRNNLRILKGSECPISWETKSARKLWFSEPRYFECTPKLVATEFALLTGLFSPPLWLTCSTYTLH